MRHPRAASCLRGASPDKASSSVTSPTKDGRSRRRMYSTSFWRYSSRSHHVVPYDDHDVTVVQGPVGTADGGKSGRCTGGRVGSHRRPPSGHLAIPVATLTA